MVSKVTIKQRYEFRKGALERLYKAYNELVDGRVKSYMIDDRQLTRLDLPWLSDQIEKMEAEMDQLQSQLDGGGARNAFAIIPRDW